MPSIFVIRKINSSVHYRVEWELHGLLHVYFHTSSHSVLFFIPMQQKAMQLQSWRGRIFVINIFSLQVNAEF